MTRELSSYSAESPARAAPTIDDTLAALADPHRRRTVELLGRGPHRAGELADALGLSAPSMSRHLRVLRQTGLVAESHPASDARVRIYTLEPSPMLELQLWLESTRAMWTDALAAFKAHLEAD